LNAELGCADVEKDVSEIAYTFDAA
jgi:hypothetical protein